MRLTKRIVLYFFILLSMGCFNANAQKKISNKEALQYIKSGNSLREAQQFERAEEFLKIGLDATKGKNKYWEASANEFLGLLYRDVSDTTKAIFYLNEALDLYKNLRVATSTKAVSTILNGLQGKVDYYAGIEIGAKGVKLSVIGARLNVEGIYQFKIIHDESINPDIVTMADSAINNAIAAVNQFIKKAEEEFKIPKEHLFLIGSSGVKEAAERANKLSDLKKQLEEGISSKKRINFIDAEEEAFLVIQGSTRPKYRAVSSTIDIGSGNTKGGFVRGIGGELLEPITFSFGTETLVPRIKERQLDGDISFDSASYLVGKEIHNEVSRAFRDNSGMRTRAIVHLVGGVVWAATSYMYPEAAQDLFVRVSPRHIRQFRDFASDSYKKATNPNLEGIADTTLRKMARANIEQAKRDFGQEQLIAGITILEALLTEYGKTPPTKKFYYARQGYIGWITGYIMREITREYEQLKE